MSDRGKAEARLRRDRGEARLVEGEVESMPKRDPFKAEAMRG
jgi:hypothetical protein